MRLTFLAPYIDEAVPSARRLLIAAAPWLVLALMALAGLAAHG